MAVIEERPLTVCTEGHGPYTEYIERVIYDRGPEHTFRRIIREERKSLDGKRIWVKEYP